MITKINEFKKIFENITSIDVQRDKDRPVDPEDRPKLFVKITLNFDRESEQGKKLKNSGYQMSPSYNGFSMLKDWEQTKSFLMGKGMSVEDTDNLKKTYRRSIMITKISEFKKILENAGISITDSDNVQFTEYLRKHWENWNGYPHAFAALKDELDELGKSKNIKFVVDNNFDMKSIDVSADKMMEPEDIKTLIDKLRAFGFMPGSEPEKYLTPQVGVSRDKPLEYTLIRMY